MIMTNAPDSDYGKTPRGRHGSHVRNSPALAALMLYLGMRNPMSVSRLQDGVHVIVQGPSGQEVPLPPFWELEDLIEQGFDRETALTFLAARRTGPCLGSLHPFSPSGPNASNLLSDRTSCGDSLAEGTVDGPLLAEARRG
jgi:hypothetical protein